MCFVSCEIASKSHHLFRRVYCISSTLIFYFIFICILKFQKISVLPQNPTVFVHLNSIGIYSILQLQNI
jgi:hypothetical protein